VPQVRHAGGSQASETKFRNATARRLCHMAIGHLLKKRWPISLLAGAQHLFLPACGRFMSRTKGNPPRLVSTRKGGGERLESAPGCRLCGSKYSFLNAVCTVPNVFQLCPRGLVVGIAPFGPASVLSHRSRPEMRSSRAYPTILRKAWLASMIRPWTSQITISGLIVRIDIRPRIPGLPVP